MANSRRKCALKSCGKYPPAETMISNGINAWCNDECRTTHAMESLNKLRKSKERAEKKAKQEVERGFRKRRQALNETDVKWQKAQTKRVAHELVKLLDANQPCIVCGGFECGQRSEWDAGHFLTKAAHPELALFLINIYKQCSLTNTASTGRKSNEATIRVKFEAGIIARQGMPTLLWLKGYHPPKKWTCEELAAYRAEMAIDVSRIKKGLPPLKDWRALPSTHTGIDSPPVLTKDQGIA